MSILDDMSRKQSMEIEARKIGLDLLREPFPAHQISKLPKPTRAQTDALKADFKRGIRCRLCGAWHHPDVVHLDYVGHAALTDRLLDCDPAWNWEPVAVAEDGTPKLDANCGMWIRLTVCGVTRLGYGHAQDKKGGDAIKEVIGDALRNAAMRFGAALDLWHKGDLHGEENDTATDTPSAPQPEPAPVPEPAQTVPQFNSAAARDRIKGMVERAPTVERLSEIKRDEAETLKLMDEQHYQQIKDAFIRRGDALKAAPRTEADTETYLDDKIPY